VIPFLNPANNQNDVADRDRILTVIVFSLFFSWLLAVPFEGQVLYAVTDFHGVSARPLMVGAMAAHFAGLVFCGFLVRNLRAAKRLILASISFCAVATGVFFFPPSFLWTAALLLAAFLVGACVAAWGFYFKGCTPKDERIKTMADGLIFSNIIMILLNMAAIHISPQFGLGFSILVLIAAFLFALRLPKEAASESPPAPEEKTITAAVANPLAFLCLFVIVISINSGLMYQTVGPAFVNLEWLTSWYWAAPYIAALFVMRNLPRKINRSYILYVAIAMIGFSFIAFLLLGRSWPDYLLVNTLLLGACGVYDLFWWSILGDMLEFGKNPAKILGAGLAANVIGVLSGGLIGNTITAVSGQIQNHTLLAFGVVCVTLVMLPPLHKQLTRLLKSHVYLTALSEMPVQEQTERIKELDIAEKLTETENKVALLLIQGKTYKAIAGEMFVSENTIRSHVKSIYGKAGVTTRAGLINLILKPPNPPS
jgi:DNA-binding CsgD family transcriptional regulator